VKSFDRRCERMMAVRTYTIVVEPDESGDFVVSVPALPGCFTHGRTLEECKVRAAEAIEVHIAGLITDGEAVPEEVSAPQLLTVTVAA
jgi:antitoxin HicB